MFVFAAVCPCAGVTSYTEPSLNVTFNVPGNVPFVPVVLAVVVVSSTLASASAASIIAFLSASVVFASTPCFQKLSLKSSPTHAAKSTPFKPPKSLTSSAFEKAFRIICVPVSIELVMLRLNFLPSSVIFPLSRLFTL